VCPGCMRWNCSQDKDYWHFQTDFWADSNSCLMCIYSALVRSSTVGWLVLVLHIQELLDLNDSLKINDH
jgi:hypothetical protein